MKDVAGDWFLVVGEEQLRREAACTVHQQPITKSQLQTK
jgi:hypothetical protein